MSTLAAIEKLVFVASRRLPLIRQAERAECGLACLAMIAGYHGLVMDLGTLRRRFSVSGQGSNLKDLIGLASQLKLSARAVKLELESLQQLQTPCVLHWDLNHFVVLKRVKRRSVQIHDPAVGAVQLSHTEFADHFTGIALELTPAETFTPSRQAQRLPLRALWSRITGLKRSLAQILLLSLLLQIYALAAPFYVQIVVDDVMQRGDTGLLSVLAMGFGLLLIIEIGTQALRSSSLLYLSSHLHLQLTSNLFHHLIRLPMNYFQRRHLGDVLSRFSSIDAVKQILTTGLISALMDGLMALVTLIAMLIYDVKLTLIVLASLLLYSGVRFSLYGPLRRHTEASITAAAESETSFIESIRAIQTIKLFQREAERQGHWQNRLVATMNKDIRIAKLEITQEAASALLFGLENLAVVYFAATAVMANTLSLGMFFAFMSYKQRFVDAIDGLLDQVIALKMLGVHLERLADIAYTERDAMVQNSDLDGSPIPRGNFSVRNLSFRYSDTEAMVFQRLSFDIVAGTTVAVVGPSGSGKSTLLKCMMGLLSAEGEIRIDGTLISRQANYRRHIAAVTQDDQLLSGSIADNIASFDSQIDPEKILDCAQLACIHDDILMLPMQYETHLGDMGSGLSGGQVQRLILARAFYREPKVLFLDEATSHLDLATEQRISKNLAAMKITRIIVAHRPETIAGADQLIDLRPIHGPPTSFTQ
jgi:ATP-binding cassette subfamily B protein RaxB